MCFSSFKPRKLKNKWKYLGSATYENSYGDRVHVGGMLVKIGSQRPFIANDSVLNNCMKIMSSKSELSTRRRGLMLYCEHYREVNKEFWS